MVTIQTKQQKNIDILSLPTRLMLKESKTKEKGNI